MGALAASMSANAKTESTQSMDNTKTIIHSGNGRSYNPVRTLNGWTLPYNIKNE